MVDPPDEQDRIIIAEDGEPIVTTNGAALLLGIHFNTVKQWVRDGKVGAPYESDGYRGKRYSWKRLQEVAGWRQKADDAQPNEAVA